MPGYFDTVSGQETSEAAIRADNPDTSFGFPFSPPARYQEIAEDAKPVPPAFHRVVPGALVEVGGRRVRTWLVAPWTAEEVVADFDAKLLALFDEKAAEKRYDNRITCALRAGYSGPFQADGVAFAQWMDDCNAHCYRVWDDVISGLRTTPTWAELLAELPTLAWPP